MVYGIWTQMSDPPLISTCTCSARHEPHPLSVTSFSADIDMAELQSQTAADLPFSMQCVVVHGPGKCFFILQIALI